MEFPVCHDKNAEMVETKAETKAELTLSVICPQVKCVLHLMYSDPETQSMSGGGGGGWMD